MGTWKRPLPEGVACEDSRLEFNPKLGAGKAEAAKPEVAVEAEVEPAKPAKPVKPAKYTERAKEEVAEAPEVVPEPQAEVAETVEAE